MEKSEKFANSGNLLTAAEACSPDFKDKTFRILEIFNPQHHMRSGFVVIITHFDDHPSEFKAFFLKKEVLIESNIQNASACEGRTFKFNQEDFKIEQA